ncbi:MAG: long-chain fatty acid transport protein [Candidatus Omnitrophota bacterium]|jgi:long-chain fatty acid transport protein
MYDTKGLIHSRILRIIPSFCKASQRYSAPILGQAVGSGGLKMYFQESRRMKKTLIAITGLTMMIPSFTFATGFALREASVEGLGKAYGGAAAGLNDNSAAWYNPAALQYAPGGGSIGLHLIDVSADFKNTGSANALTGAPISGGNGGGGGDTAVVPNAYYVHAINDQATFGFALTAPFGLGSEWDKDWVGRYHAIKSELLTLNLNPSIGYKVNDQLSLGFGFSAMYAEAEISNAINLGVVTGGPAPDGFGSLEGDDWGYGYNLGAVYALSEDSRVGLAYRSEIETTIEGDAKFQIAPPIAAAFAPRNVFVNTGGSADLDLPANVALGYTSSVTDDISVGLTVDWTGWSSFQELRVDFDSLQPDSVTEENWDDTWSVGVGLDYAQSDKVTLRGGFLWDESPISNPSFRTPRIPDSDRYWVTAGFSYDLSDTSRIDAGFAHIFADDETAKHANSTGDVIVGSFEADVNIISLQFSRLY